MKNYITISFVLLASCASANNSPVVQTPMQPVVVEQEHNVIHAATITNTGCHFQDAQYLVHYEELLIQQHNPSSLYAPSCGSIPDVLVNTVANGNATYFPGCSAGYIKNLLLPEGGCSVITNITGCMMLGTNISMTSKIEWTSEYDFADGVVHMGSEHPHCGGTYAITFKKLQ